MIAAQEAHAAAKDLECSARDGDWHTAEISFVELRGAVERLQPALQDLVAD